MGNDAAHTAAGELVTVAGEGEPDTVKPVEGEAVSEGVLDEVYEGEAPTESVPEGDAVPDDDGVPVGVGRLETVDEGEAVGSW